MGIEILREPRPQDGDYADPIPRREGQEASSAERLNDQKLLEMISTGQIEDFIACASNERIDDFLSSIPLSKAALLFAESSENARSRIIASLKPDSFLLAMLQRRDGAHVTYDGEQSSGPVVVGRTVGEAHQQREDSGFEVRGKGGERYSRDRKQDEPEVFPKDEKVPSDSLSYFNESNRSELAQVREIGPLIARKICLERQKQPFSDFYDLQQRVSALDMQKIAIIRARLLNGRQAKADS